MLITILNYIHYFGLFLEHLQIFLSETQDILRIRLHGSRTSETRKVFCGCFCQGPDLSTLQDHRLDIFIVLVLYGNNAHQVIPYFSKRGSCLFYSAFYFYKVSFFVYLRTQICIISTLSFWLLLISGWPGWMLYFLININFT